MNEKQVFVNKEHKDNVFRILYRDDKTRQIELYNAVSGKNYTEDADLEVVTLKHAIYMGMKNDLAFIVSDDLHLYEDQSTINPNMPLRFLHYISKEYEGLVEGRKLYGSTPVKLQTPYFTVFYNGTKKYPERLILKLSDLYKMSELTARRKPCKPRAFHLLVLPETIWNIYLIPSSKEAKIPNSAVIAAKPLARSAGSCSRNPRSWN